MSVDRAAGPASRVAALAGALVLLSLAVASRAPASSDETAPPDSTGWEEPLGSDTLDLPVAGADSIPPFTILSAPPETGAGWLPESPLELRIPRPDSSRQEAGEGALPGAFRLRPEPGGEFARPWSAWDVRRTGGLRVVAAAVPGALASSAPFEREFTVDLDREWMSVATRSTGRLAFLSYAAPLAEYQNAAAERQVLDGWRRTILTDLGKQSGEAAGSILDIDIPMPLPGPFVRAIGPGANLKVRGSERITFGGQTSYVVDALQQETAPPSKFPQLDMQQQLTVNLEGTIGRKIHVYVDHRSGGEGLGVGKANQIRVHYDGDEDEIIQKIELGEVSLSLPGTEFVSYSGGQEGLFGAKMSAKIGKLDLVSIASKEEGKSAGASFTGTSESDSLVITDIGYEARTFFAVDGAALKYSNVGLQQLRVYVDDRDGSNDIETGASGGVAYLADPVTPSAPPSGPQQQGMFDQLVELEDYLVDYQTGIVQFTPPIADDDVLAVSYERVDGTSVGGSDGAILRLKMIKKGDRVVGTEWQRTRLYELKNVYDLGAEGIPQEGFELVIRKRTPSGDILDNEDGKPFIEILGLDSHDLSGVGVPDGLVDLEWIDFEKGYLSFPHFTPFCPAYDETTNFYYVAGDTAHYRAFARELDPKNCVVYSEETFDPADDIYFLEVKYNRPKTTFYLGQINIIENSEVVRLNGVKLTRGADYTIYYPAGQLTLLAEEAKEPDAKVTVDFDYQPFGIGGEKTLLGARGVFNWNENIQLGTTWMYQSKGTPEERPRLGEEPSRTMLGDVNLSARFKPELLTRIADAIPLVDTDAPSRLELDAEAAVCVPEPNTKGFVSVDDMEGTKNVSMLGVTRRLWVPSSIPVDPTGIPAVADTDRMDIRWYNPDRLVREGDLFPYLPDEEFNDIHTVLALRDYASDGTWAGLMRLLSKTGVDYSDYEFVEFWVDAGADPAGTVRVELGTLSEDFYPLRAPNGALDSEDVDRNGFDADEDTGLDNVFGADGDQVPGDDGNDDYVYEYGSDDYLRINGTENDDRLDTEDLNGNWYLDSENRYWSLTVDLDDDTYLIQDNSTYPDAAKRTNWRLYRVPLSDAVSVGGMIDWRSVKSARIWIEGVPLSEPVLLGSLDVVGNQWEAGPIRDAEDHVVPGPELAGAAFRVASKNTKEDLDYVPPFDPGVDEDTDLPKREQSLALLYENLGSGQSGAATKVSYSDENYTDYQSLEFYVHGEADVEEGTLFFIRLGADTLNYYEYSFEVRPGWLQKAGAARNRLSMPFSGFSDLKLDPYAGMDTVVVWGDTTLMKREAFKRVGWPSLSRVRRLTVGVRNGDTADPSSRITGEVWVDDLRLADVHKEVGWAQRATVRASLADLADGSFDLRHMDGDFHTLKQTRGSGQDNLTYNATATLNADRFVSGLGISLPVNTTWKRSITRPKFSTGSDVVLDAEESEKEKTETLERSLSVALARKRQSPDFWTHLLADGLSLRASIGDQQRIAPTKADTSQTVRGRISYKYSPEKAGIRIFRDTYFFLKPTDLRFSADTYLTHAMNYDIAASGVKTLRTDRYDKKLDAEVNVDFEFLDNLQTAHSVSAKRDLAQTNRTVADVNIGVETERRYTNTLNFSPKFGSWLSPQYSFSSSFNDNHGPDVRLQGDPPDVRNIRVQSDQDLRASFDMKKIFGLSQPRRPAPRTQPPAREAPTEGHAAEEASPRAPSGDEETEERQEPAHPQGRTIEEEPEIGAPEDAGPGAQPEMGPEAPPEPGVAPSAGEAAGEKKEGEGGKPEPTPAEGPGFEMLFEPVLGFFRSMDAIEGGYGVQRTSKYDRVTADEVPGWAYRLGLTRGVGSDDRTEEHVLTLGTGAKVTEAIRVKGDYRRRMSGRWYSSAVADTIRITSRSESMDESTKGTLSWSGLERIGLLSGRLSSMRARSGVEYKRSYSGPYGEPTSKGRGLALSPIVSVDATFKNGLTGSLSWDRKRSLGYSLSGAGSVTEDVTGSTSVTVNYRFSAPQGLKLPFFGEKLKFQSNLDCSLTLKTSSKTSRTAPSEGVLPNVDPTSSVRELSVVGDATYSFSRSVSGGLQVSFSQSRDEKRDQTRRTIGVHLTAEFKF